MRAGVEFERYLREEARAAELFVARVRRIAVMAIFIVPLFTLPVVAPEERGVRTSGLPPTEERTGLTLKGISEPPRIYAVAWRG